MKESKPHRIMDLLSIQSRWARIAVISLAVGVCAILDILLYPYLGMISGVVMVVPVIAAAWYFGMRASTPVLVIGILINILAGHLAGENEWDPYLLLTNLIGAIPAAMAGYIVSRVRILSQTRQRELFERSKSDEDRRVHAEFLSALNDIVRVALEAEHLQSLLQLLADQTGPLFGADDCFITLWDETNNITIPSTAYGPMHQNYTEVTARPGQRTLTTSVLEAGHALIVQDIAHNPYVDEDVAQPFQELVTALGLPLIAGERKLGAVILGYHHQHHFTEEEVERAEMAGRQISLALMKVILLDETRQRLKEISGLHALSQAFTINDVQRTFGLLTETVAGLIGAKMCAVVLLDSTGTEFRGEPDGFGLSGDELAQFRCPADIVQKIRNSFPDNFFRANSPGKIPDFFSVYQQRLNVENVLVTPLWGKGHEFIGVMIAANKSGGFSDKDIRLMEIFCSQAEVVVENTRLLSAERRRAEELSALHKISIAATEAHNEDELIERVMSVISERLFPDNFGILLVDEKRNELYLHSSYWLGERVKPVRLPVDQGIAGSVVKSGKPRCENDVSQAPDYIIIDERTRSELCAPLKVGEHVIGVINAESSHLNAFTREDENLMSTMAAQIAIAIQRLRTADTEHHQKAQLIRANALVRILARVGAQIAVAQTPDGVMKALGDELTKIGLVCLVALHRDPNNMEIAYTSMSPRLIRYIERLAKHPLTEFKVPYERLIAYSGHDPKPEMLKDPLAITSSILVDFPVKVAYRILRPAGASEVMPLCHLPLVAEGKLNGIMWLWGEGLSENDLPTLSIFASQVAIAIQNARLIEEVHRLAITDEGTGIFNRRYFFQLAELEFSRAVRYKHPLSAIIVDIDGFKAFNDHYGHIIGDLVLRQVAQTLKNNLREGDVLGRYGGEEFSILLPYTDRKSARKVGERLCAQVAAAGVKTDNGVLAVKVSVGAAELKPKTRHLLALVEAADIAMYAAKAKGGNRVYVNR